MKTSGIVVIALGVAIFGLGAVIILQFLEVRGQIEQAQAASGPASLGRIFEALRALLRWVNDAFVLLIVNLFLTGIALVISGIALARAGARTK